MIPLSSLPLKKAFKNPSEGYYFTYNFESNTLQKIPPREEIFLNLSNMTTTNIVFLATDLNSGLRPCSFKYYRPEQFE